MKPLSIDFVPPRTVPVWGAVLCALLFAAALAASLAAWSTYRVASAERLRGEVAQRNRQSAEVAMKVAPSRVPLRYEADARRAAREAAFETAQALSALEHAGMIGVMLVSVELQAETGVSRVEVEFGDQPILLKYLEELNSGNSLLRWHLMRAASKGAGQTGGVAVLEARW